MCSNERGSFAAGNNLTDHQIWFMEARRLDAPSLWSVLEDQACSPLCSASFRHDRWQLHHVVTQPAVAIGLVSDFGLRQYHQVEADGIYFPDGLCEPRSPDVADVEGPEGYSPGARIPSMRWRWCQVEEVSAMDDRSGEINGNLSWVP